ncbi:redox-sensitive transcriptional activator SoxR [Motiliproteus coralliicola]|uniref:Redox-sensitive transcriptional activator SoxR n=1 Tax=Motiliproteus coralliicola TaxID=2283196 RepID=A0A369WSY0_9GAMM|nr:redox-sensitive transcriptional activator SoxR [Motiliproteus coralliicola]RDE24179.1 redox-sensitive transcriptional activator SoxR [Motiliproteus coralliicola]
MKKNEKLLTIGEAAERADLNQSALRFYEKRGLISSIRTEGNQRRYPLSMLRRISVIRAAQRLGLTLEEIEQALASLPDNRTPTKRDWERLSARWGEQLDQRILQMQRLRNSLSGCIGCGCLSLQSCELFNAEDHIASHGNGPRYLIEGTPEEKGGT